MQNQILNFIEKYSDKVVTDVARRMTLRFIVPVNELFSIEFMKNSEIVTNSFLYDSVDPFEGNVEEFIALFGSDDYKAVSNTVNVNVTIKKDKLKFDQIDNFYFFLDHINFFSSLTDINLNNNSKKLIVLLIGENLEFESKFIHMLALDQFSKYLTSRINDDIDEEETNNLEELNSTFKNKKLNSYLEYPISWISKTNNTSLPLFKHKVLQTFFSIISNTIISENTFIIRGYKTIQFNSLGQGEVSEEVCNDIGELMKFIIDKQRGHDKLLLLRNTLTLYLDSDENSDGLGNKFSEIKKNVEFNFNAYVQDKIKIFLDQKNQLLQEFISTTKKIESLTNDLINQVRTVLLSLLGTIFIGLLKDINSSESSGILNLVMLSYIFFFIIQFIIVWYHNKQQDALLDSLKEYTKEFGKVETDIESNYSYDKLKKRYLKKSIDIYDTYRRWTMLLLVLLIVLFAFLYISNRFINISLPKDIIKFIIGY